jgi:hypothetical protein
VAEPLGGTSWASIASRSQTPRSSTRPPPLRHRQVLHSICTDLVPKSAGAATGVIVTFFSASGVLIPFLVGGLTDITTSFDAAFLMLSGIVGSGALGLLLFARPASKS